MTRRKPLRLMLSIAQLDMLQAAQQNHSVLDALGGIPLGLKTSVDLAKLEILEKLAYSISPKGTREWITREAILDKVLRLRRIAEADADHAESYSDLGDRVLNGMGRRSIHA